MAQFYATLPAGAKLEWRTPEWAHSDEMPFCGDMDCRCHHDPERMERFVVRPVERGELDIPAALDRYYCRLLIGTGGRK